MRLSRFDRQSLPRRHDLPDDAIQADALPSGFRILMSHVMSPPGSRPESCANNLSRINDPGRLWNRDSQGHETGFQVTRLEPPCISQLNSRSPAKTK